MNTNTYNNTPHNETLIDRFPEHQHHDMIQQIKAQEITIAKNSRYSKSGKKIRQIYKNCK